MKQMSAVVVIPLMLFSAATQAQMPQTPWGDPDLQGRWSNGTLTPLLRPRELGDKAFYTEEEAQAYVTSRLTPMSEDERIEAEQASGDVGSYNSAFFDRGESIVPTRRTSLIIDTPDGRAPAFTPEAQAQYERNLAYAKEHPADTAEDRYLTERCIVFGGGAAPMTPEPYNNNYYIVQKPDTVTIMAELNHEVRIIPIDGRPHFPEQVRQWVGDSRGHWEDDTLVVETTNQYANRHFYGVQMLDSVMSDNFRVVERFTRAGPEEIRYQATVHDPEVFVQPWTIEVFMYPQEQPLVEYACHEGNYGLSGILSAERVREAAGQN